MLSVSYLNSSELLEIRESIFVSNEPLSDSSQKAKYSDDFGTLLLIVLYSLKSESLSSAFCDSSDEIFHLLINTKYHVKRC